MFKLLSLRPALVPILVAGIGGVAMAADDRQADPAQPVDSLRQAFGSHHALRAARPIRSRLHNANEKERTMSPRPAGDFPDADHR